MRRKLERVKDLGDRRFGESERFGGQKIWRERTVMGENIGGEKGRSLEERDGSRTYRF